MTALAECIKETGPEREFPDPGQLAANVSGLVSPPLVCVKMCELVQSARASTDEIGDVVALDPNMAARLLRIVNSSFYGFPSQVDTIARAVTILGTRDLYNLVLAISAVRSFSKVGADLVRLETFWRHSIFCALLARQLAIQCRLADAERLFVAGLLHDIGICVIYHQLPEQVQRMRAIMQTGESALHDAELEQLGFSHAAVGALVLEQWQLPAELLGAVAHHHNPGAAQVGRVEAALVHIADVLANRSEPGALVENPQAAPEVDDDVWNALGIAAESIDFQQVMLDANARFAAAARILLPRNGR